MKKNEQFVKDPGDPIGDAEIIKLRHPAMTYSADIVCKRYGFTKNGESYVINNRAYMLNGWYGKGADYYGLILQYDPSYRVLSFDDMVQSLLTEEVHT